MPVVALLAVLAAGPYLCAQAASTGAAASAAPSGNQAGKSAIPGQTTASPHPDGGPTGAAVSGDTSQADAEKAAAVAVPSTLWKYRGVRIDKVEFEGVDFDQEDAIRKEFQVQSGQLLDPAGLRATVRRLYATGLYRDIDVRGVASGMGNQRAVTIIFRGTPRYFIGRVLVEGVRPTRLLSIVEYSTQLQPGTRYTPSQVETGATNIKQALAQNGYYDSTVTSAITRDEENKLVNITYTVVQGVQARIGNVALDGKDPGMTVEEFRKTGKLKQGKKVTRDTTSNALTRLRQHYQKKDRLEAKVALEKQEYAPPRKQLDYRFNAEQGPVVKVVIQGAKVSKSRQKKLLPIYEESTVDNDLLNEGAHNIREFLQRQGYFDAQVDPHIEGVGTPQQTVVFQCTPGQKYRVVSVDVTGNKYFDLDTMRERMQVVKADPFVRNGRYSQALLQNDVDSITSLYHANGFTHVKVETKIERAEDKGKLAQIRVKVNIIEGEQQKFGKVTIAGVDAQRESEVRGMMNVIGGQPFSLNTVSADRDAILQYYLSNGFDQAKVEVRQKVEDADPSLTDIAFQVVEGEQVFVHKVLVSGAERTKPALINRQLQLKPGDPLDQSALVETQRKLYDLAIFNQANVAVQNPEGLADRKNVLVQLTEAKRWDVTYGAGFEAQTGQPQTNCRAQASIGATSCTPGGKAGASFRVSLDVTRINLRGSDRSLTLHTTYGLLERVATLSYNLPRLFNNDNLTGLVSGGYSNVQNISTFKASTLQGLFRITQKVPRADTFIYDFTYRRVSVDQNSLQVTANLIPLLSQPVRVGGPGVTWFHDTRSPSPLDAQRGRYLSVQEFLSNSAFGSQTNFTRTDIAYATYYTWGTKRKYTFARNTRFGFENASGTNPNVGTPSCLGILLTTNASCQPVPLPERLYAGGGTSHRGFSLNSAGPRDLTTGFPVGGSAVFINTLELRLPPPTLPLVGSSVSFVLFHDMGNVFLNIKDLWPSFGRFSQPNKSTCYNVYGFQQTGTCDFAYFSHAVGLGARYGTPVGPIRLDFAYNLNPPVYPIIDDYTKPQPNHQVGHASKFQFFFSIGQSF
ncbi:MAG: BamA/TamA family outer membrane protein [Acidobacteria bacterium]|nr:BamA/TamA family outer membrane protein [Acidobacteriota bacterium]